MAKYINIEEITPIMAEYVADVFSRKEHLDDISYSYCMEIADTFRRYAERAKQEQPKKSQKSCNDCPHCVDRKDQFGWHFKGCFGGPYNGKFIAEIDKCPLEMEQEEKKLPEGLESDVTMLENILGTYKTLEDMLDLSTGQDQDILESMNFEREWLKKRLSQKMPEGLENAAQDSADLLQQRQKNYSPTYWCGAYDGFIAGAEYQRKQDQQLIELAEDHAMLAGMNKMKEEMMEKAVEGEVVAGKEGDKWLVTYVGDYESMLKVCKIGDKVKVIVIKEDEK